MTSDYCTIASAILALAMVGLAINLQFVPSAIRQRYWFIALVGLGWTFSAVGLPLAVSGMSHGLSDVAGVLEWTLFLCAVPLILPGVALAQVPQYRDEATDILN